MPGGTNLATKYSRVIDEKWSVQSLVSHVCTPGAYSFRGDKTVVVYSIPTAPLNDYVRSGSNRYGTVDDLGRNIQTLVVSQDKAFTFVIDKGDEIQSEFVSNPGTALARQIKHQIVPSYDRYCFNVMCNAAKDNGGYGTTAATAANAYSLVLAGTEWLSDRGVPVDQCVLFVSAKFFGLLITDDAFIKEGDRSQRITETGKVGWCAGMDVILVPSDRLPGGTSFLIVHKDSIVAPKQLEEYKIHENAPGISGYLVEGRAIYDCFVLNEKADGLYYHGGQEIIGKMAFHTVADAAGKSKVIIEKDKDESTNKWFAITKATKAALPTVTYGTPINTASGGSWHGATQLTSNAQALTIASGNKYIAVCETDDDDYPIYYSTGKLNIG